MRVKGTSIEERKLVVYQEDNQSKCLCYDGRKAYKISKELIKQSKKYPLTSKEIYVKFEKTKETPDIELFYNQFEAITNELKKITDGKVNLYKTGSYSLSALQLFYDLLDDTIPEPEQIEQREADILNAATIGPLRYARPYTGQGYKYDFISRYPAIMAGNNNFPYAAPKKLSITQQEFNEMKTLKYGLYKCKIINNHELFMANNRTTWYSHDDIIQARKLNLGIEIVEEDEFNFLHYHKLISGKRLFGKFVNYLFPLKQQGYKSIKYILNVLWGCLCQTNIVELVMTNSNNAQVYDDDKIDMILPMQDDSIKLYIPKKHKQFTNNWGRMKVFLLSIARKKLATTLLDYTDNIVYIHTDGFIINKPFETNEYVKFGNNLGQLKYEGYCQSIEVKNMAFSSRNYKWII